MVAGEPVSALVPPRPAPLDAGTRTRLQRLRRRDTAPELALRAALWRLGLRYRVDYCLPGTRRRADIAFTRSRLAVFVDGCFWHGCPEHVVWPKNNARWWREKILATRARDAETDERAAALGWVVLRFWEHDDPVESARTVAASLACT